MKPSGPGAGGRPPRAGAGVSDAARDAHAELRGTFAGELFRPGDRGYGPAREIWNAAITRRPAVIARCRTAADVALAVRAARAHDLEISVRGGGHNIAGTALTDGGLTVDLSAMTGWRADPDAGTIEIEMGMTWGAFDAAAHSLGRATPGGIVSTTGVAGLTLGGGFGWLSRRFGWSCDNLLSARVVTAGGEQVRARAGENADLFWALRGGGGNFGVVRSAVFRTHQVARVFGGSLVWPLHRAAAVLRRCDEVISASPDTVCFVIGIGPPPAAAAGVGPRALRISLCDSGSERSGRGVVAALTSGHPPAFDLTRVMTYPELQAMLDAGGVRGFGHYAKSTFLSGLPDAAVAVLLSHAASVPSARSRIVLHTCGGAAGRVEEAESAFGHRSAAYNLQIDSTWTMGDDETAHVAWARALYGAMAPFGSGGVYVNFLGEDAGHAGVLAAYGDERYRRLRRVKATYDPHNAFHVNQNIPPAPAPEGDLAPEGDPA